MKFSRDLLRTLNGLQKLKPVLWNDLNGRRNSSSRLQRGMSKDGSFKRNAPNVKSSRSCMKSRGKWSLRGSNENGKRSRSKSWTSTHTSRK